MKILVTGGAGFMGSHLCEKYVKEGHTVVCLDNFMNGDLGNVRALLNYSNFKLVNGDVRNFDMVEKLARDSDVIFHLAAQIHVDRSIIEPRMTYDINVFGTLNVLEAARIYDVKKTVLASSSEVYGPALTAPMKESHPLRAPHIYGASKIAQDRMAFAYINTYGMNVTITRPFNVFGPRQKDTGYGGAIGIFVRRALSGMPPIIYGDGKQTRDYTYIKDTVNMYDLLLKHDKPIREPINFGTGKEISILGLAKLIIRAAGKEGTLKPVFVDKRPGEVSRLIADASNGKKLLGWQPKYTLEQGLEEYVDWYKNYKSEEWAKPG